jgi:hypothetical protein
MISEFVSASIKLMELDCSSMNHDNRRYQFNYAIKSNCVTLVFYMTLYFLLLPSLCKMGP